MSMKPATALKTVAVEIDGMPGGARDERAAIILHFLTKYYFLTNKPEHIVPASRLWLSECIQSSRQQGIIE